MMPGTIFGPAALRKAWKGLTGLLSGMRVEIEEVIEQGENAVVRWRMIGRHEAVPSAWSRATPKSVSAA